MSSLKVLMVAQSTHGGGAEQVAAHWRRILHEHGVDLKLVVLEPPQSEPQRRRRDAIDETFVLPRGPLRRVRALRKIAKTWGADTALGVLSYPNILTQIACLGLPTRVVISEHTVPTILLKSSGLKQRIQLYIAKLIYRKADAVVAVSHGVAADLRLNFRVNPTRLWVMPNQIFEEKRIANKPNFDQSPTRRFQLIVPGRITRAKRPDYIIGIVEQLEARGHSVTVEFIGDARDGYPVDTLINSTSHVRISSWRDDWAKNAEPGSIVVLPSHVEGFGNVLVEAAQQELISVVGSNSIGAADAVIDGVTGVLVSPDLPEAFADGIEQASLIEFGKLPGWIERFSGGPTSRRLLKLVGVDDQTDAHLGSSI